MTMFCFLKENVDKYYINANKRSSLFWSAIIIQSCVSFMLSAMLWEMITD